MNAIAMIKLLSSLYDIGMKVNARFTETAALFSKMSEDGRTELTKEEAAKMVYIRDAARQTLVDELTGLNDKYRS